jgi:two-component system, cell cycle sensor histidine kinase and response regulator CckA
MNGVRMAAQRSLHGARILVAEDETLIADELEERLRRMGLDVVGCVTTAEEALNLADGSRPDVVLMDIRLKGSMDGIEAADVLRTRHHVPVVYLTAHSDDATIHRAKLTEPYGYLLKPFDELDLRVALEMALHKHETERRLRESEQRLATTLTSIGDAVIATDAEGRITFLNPVAEALTKWPSAEAQGERLDTVFHIVDAVTRLAPDGPIARALREDRIVSIGDRMLLLAKDGTEVPIDDSAAPIRNERGELLGGVLVFRDISERQRAAASLRAAEEQLRQAQKMEAIGRLAGGVAHDINNMMTVVLGYADLLLGQLDPADPTHGMISEIKRAADRSAGITRQLLAFGRRQILQPAVVDLNKLVGGLSKILAQLLGAHIEVRFNLDPQAWPVLADPGQIDQVILNLCLNARDAMLDGGVLTIETGHVTLGEANTLEMTDVAPGEYVILSVSDTGVGMDAATRSHVFEPFFTTKATGEGTGLGLATVYGIVKQSRGHIYVSSEPQEGTTFTVYLPKAEGASAGTPTDETAAPRGRESVLLVDDDAGVRSVSAAILRRHGYSVVEAGNGAEALLLCQADARRFDLLLTDAIMPNLSGRALADRLKMQRPGLRVLFMSGYTEDRILRQRVRDAADAFIQKPFAGSELARRVREVLDAPPLP